MNQYAHNKLLNLAHYVRWTASPRHLGNLLRKLYCQSASASRRLARRYDKEARMRNLFFYLIISLVITGCGTVAKGPEFVTLADKSDNYSILYLYRGEGREYNGYTPTVVVGRVKFHLMQNGYAYLCLPEGTYRIAMSSPFLSANPTVKGEIHLIKGERRFVEVKDLISGPYAETSLTEKNESLGLLELQGKKFDPELSQKLKRYLCN